MIRNLGYVSFQNGKSLPVLEFLWNSGFYIISNTSRVFEREKTPTDQTQNLKTQYRLLHGFTDFKNNNNNKSNGIITWRQYN